MCITKKRTECPICGHKGIEFNFGKASGPSVTDCPGCGAMLCTEGANSPIGMLRVGNVRPPGRKFDFEQYQEMALERATYPDVGDNILYPAMGLAGEAGEVCDKVKKWWRNEGITSGKQLSDEQRMALQREVGDILWYIAAMAKELGYPMWAIAQSNLVKLNDRHERGVLKGEGDDR